MTSHGMPSWYELCTTDPDRAQAFYSAVMGWHFAPSALAPDHYRLATSHGDMVAGLMVPDTPMPCFWMIYFTTYDCDRTVLEVLRLGGHVHRGPEDIPSTGRFAIVSDPQGAVFGLLHPVAGQEGHAFDQTQDGHGNWHELTSTDPNAGFAFYRGLMAWRPDVALEMGALGRYQIFAKDGTTLGGIMGLRPSVASLGAAGLPSQWMPYFGVNSVLRATQAIQAKGGKTLFGPQEVPGGAYIAIGQDPEGARFAVVGPKAG